MTRVHSLVRCLALQGTIGVVFPLVQLAWATMEALQKPSKPLRENFQATSIAIPLLYMATWSRRVEVVDPALNEVVPKLKSTGTST